MELLKPIVESSKVDGVLGTYLHSCQEQLSFLNPDASEEKSLITTINRKLNEPSTRFVGLSLLHPYIQHCAQNTVNENAILWMTFCVKGAVSPFAPTSNLSFNVLSSLFQRCSDQGKHVASAVLPKFFEHLTSVRKPSLPAALNCLESCMKIYNGPCGPHKNSIQKFLIPLLEYSGPNKTAVRWKAAVCIALVPQLGGGGAGGTSHQENWTKQLRMACSTLHEVLDALFSSVHELEVHNVDSTRTGTFPFQSIEQKDPVTFAYSLAARFEGVVFCVQAMLLGEFGVVKNVPPSDILSVICRGLAVTSVSLQNTSTTESLALLSILPTLQTNLFELLIALIDCCGANLLPFSRLVLRLVLQTLKWTSVKDWNHRITKPHRSLRTAAYRCLKRWLDSVRTIPSSEEVAELVEMVCSDFRTEEDILLLLSGKKKNKYVDRNDAKRKRASNTPHDIDGSACPPDPKANKDVCIAALQTAQALLAVHGWALNGGSYTTLQETTVKLALCITSQPHNPVIPYGDSEARVEVYRLLLSLVMHPHPHIPAPVRMAWRLFSLGQNDPDLQVSTFCFQALNNVEKVVQPSFVPLALPIPETEDDQTANDSLLTTSSAKQSPEDSIYASKGVGVNVAEVETDPGKTTEKIPQKSPETVEKIRKREESVETVEKNKKDENKKKDAPDNVKQVNKIEPVETDLPADNKLSNGLSKTSRDEEMIEVSDSGSNGDDIEEVPVEIDIADSEGSSDDGETIIRENEGGDGVEIIAADLKGADDFRLRISPDPDSQRETVKRKENKSPVRRAKEKRGAENSADKDGEPPAKILILSQDAKDDVLDVESPAKVSVVSKDANDDESDVEAMLASFVDKVKPQFEGL